MKESEKNYKLIWVLLAIVIIMSTVKIKYGYRGEATPTATQLGGQATPTATQLGGQATPTETVVVTPTVSTESAVVLDVDETKYPLWAKVPYSGNGFTVEKYIAPKVLLVQLEGAASSSATKAVNEWLRAFGDAGKGHKLEFESLLN
jgi:hypothetical protein